MARSYSDKDVARWHSADEEDIPIEYERICGGDTQGGRRIARYSRMHESAALVQVALGRYGYALGHFAASAAAWASLLERHVNGEPVDSDLLERSSSRPFNLALAAGDQVQVARLSRVYKVAFPNARTSTNSNHWIALVVAALANDHVELASEWVASAPQSLAEAPIRYLRAIIDCDAKAFAAHCDASTADWKRILRSERLGRFPDAVCNHLLLGSIRLVEKVWGSRPEVDLGPSRIPPTLLDSKSEPIHGMI